MKISNSVILPRHPGDPLDIHDLLAVWQHLHVPQRLIVEGRYDPSAKKQKGMKKEDQNQTLIKNKVDAFFLTLGQYILEEHVIDLFYDSVV